DRTGRRRVEHVFVWRPLAALDTFDRRLFDRLTREERRLVDRSLKRLSNSANRSLLWLAIAGVMTIAGGRRERRAALRGAVSIALTSTLVNLPLKYLARRDRPVLRRGDRPLPVSMPGSFSFPSGHSASAFAFATGVGMERPQMLVPILPLAAGVSYSRVHLRVHYPFDVLVGAAIGTGLGLASGPVIRAARQWWGAVAPAAAAERGGRRRRLERFRPLAQHANAGGERRATPLSRPGFTRRCRTPDERGSTPSTLRSRGRQRAQRPFREIRHPGRPAPPSGALNLRRRRRHGIEGAADLQLPGRVRREARAPEPRPSCCHQRPG